MKKPLSVVVKIAAFKAHMGQYLRAVRLGHPLTLLDRETPIARIIPCSAVAERLTIRKATRDPRSVHLPLPLKRSIDSLRALLEERADRL